MINIMGKKKKRYKLVQKNIARRRIEKLFIMAEEAALQNRFNLANRYVEIARKISMRYLVQIPKRFKRCFCKNCYRYMLPGRTARIRINHGKIVVFCFNCKKISRFIIK